MPSPVWTRSSLVTWAPCRRIFASRLSTAFATRCGESDRRPTAVELPPEIPSADPSPLDRAVEHETYDHYRRAMSRLKPRERELVIARVEAQWSVTEIAEHFGFNTADGARMAVNRAMQRLSAVMREERGS